MVLIQILSVWFYCLQF